MSNSLGIRNRLGGHDPRTAPDVFAQRTRPRGGGGGVETKREERVRADKLNGLSNQGLKDDRWNTSISCQQNVTGYTNLIKETVESNFTS